MVNNVYSLPEVDFIGGSSVDLVFNVYSSGRIPRPFWLSGCTANFSVIDFVNRNSAPIITKAMGTRMGGSENSEEQYYNVLFVKLDPGDTINLFGKYIYQITIVDPDGNIDPHQGVIYVHKNINKPFVSSVTATQLA